MSIAFPSVEFFRTLQEKLAEDAARTEPLAPSEAYCGISVDDQLFVLEFDGRVVSAVVGGGNPLDLDFVLAAPKATWCEAIASGNAKPLADLLDAKAISLESAEDDGQELAQSGLPMLQALLDQAQELDVTTV